MSTTQYDTETILNAFGTESRERDDHARWMREEYGLRPFWRQLYESSDAGRIDTSADAIRWPEVVPDCLIHLRRDERELLKRENPDLSDYPRSRRQILRWLATHEEALQAMSIGGTDFLGTGPPGSGKSTLANDLARQILEINPSEAVLWRGTPSRAEWTPLAPWTRLMLPESQDVQVRVQPPVHSVDAYTLEPSTLVGEVVRYRDPYDLLDELEAGRFHVIYPDPLFAGVEDLFRKSSRTGDFEYITQAEAESDPDLSATPLSHWWFAWIIALVDEGGPEWITQIIDEVGDLLPQDARSGESNHYWYELITAYRDTLVDARKTNTTIMNFGHNEEDVHSLARRKYRWRITMPGWPNPTEGDNVVGFGTAPMKTQLAQHMTVGDGLYWTATNFSEFSWSDVPKPTAARISLEYGSTQGVSR